MVTGCTCYHAELPFLKVFPFLKPFNVLSAWEIIHMLQLHSVEKSSLPLSMLLTVAPMTLSSHCSELLSLASTLPTTARGSDVSHTTSFLHGYSFQQKLSSWRSCLGSLLALLKYDLNKQHLHCSTPFLSQQEGASAACEMQEMGNQRWTSSTWKGSAFLSALPLTMSGVSMAAAAAWTSLQRGKS